MRISDWSSDMCSSDLDDGHVVTQLAYEIDGEEGRREIYRELPGAEKDDQPREIAVAKRRAQSLDQSDRFGGRGGKPWFGEPRDAPGADQPGRSEERRVGKEWVSTWSCRWRAYHYKKNRKNYTD